MHPHSSAGGAQRHLQVAHPTSGPRQPQPDGQCPRRTPELTATWARDADSAPNWASGGHRGVAGTDVLSGR
jgi:hypothetical protein